MSNCPNSIVKYQGFFKMYVCSFVRFVCLLINHYKQCNNLYSHNHCYLVMKHGGNNLLPFIAKIHEHISIGTMKVNEWHKMIKIIFKSMIQSMEFIHNKSIYHLGISLENYVINNVHYKKVKNEITNEINIRFDCDKPGDPQVKLYNFGVSEVCIPSSGIDKFCGKVKYLSPEMTKYSKNVNPTKHDIWCLGICLFIMSTGYYPWTMAYDQDEDFAFIMRKKGNLKRRIKYYRCLHLVNDELLHLIEGILQYENKRMSLSQIKQHSWLN